jgi:hypothetical protein
MMNRILRLLIVFVLSGGIFMAAQGGSVWAGPAVGNPSAALPGDIDPAPASSNAAAGTVHPPANSIFITENGHYSVGGICTIQVTGLSDGYGLKAYNINRSRLGPLPAEAMRILSGTCYLQYYELTPRVAMSQLPAGAGNITVCFAHIPPNKQGQIFSYDLVGGTWSPLATFVERVTPSNQGIACASALQSQAYALLRIRE